MTADAGDIAFVRVLGPVQAVTTSGHSVDLASSSQRRLVALLAAEAPRSVRAERIQDVLAVSPSALRTTVSRVRGALGAGAIGSLPGHYRLTLPVDAARFSDALSEMAEVSEVRSSGDRADSVRAALELWSGPPYDEFATEDWARPEVTRLTELQASAVEDLASELIVARRWPEAIAELQRHVVAHPLRDRSRGLLLRALAAEGRQADALRAFEDYRVHLAESVGTEPSADVRRIDRLIASGWDGIEADDADESAPSRGPQRPSSWLPLSPELAQQTEVFGRARELAELTSDLALVGGTGSRTVVVEGEAGIGKTTLLAGFAQSVHAQSAHAESVKSGAATVLYGRCPPDPAPLEPFRSLFEHVVDHLPADVLEAHTARYGQRLGRMLPHRSGQLDPPRMTDVDDATERHLLFEAAGDLLRRIGTTNPVVVLLDDLQWAEPTALGLLRHLGRQLVDAPILWVVSVRDTDQHRPSRLSTALADLERRPSRRIALRGLDDRELIELARSLVPVAAGAGDGAAIADGAFEGLVTTRLREATAGNPLYAIHLVRHWAESGHLVARAGSDSPDDASAEPVPASLRNLLWSRVTMLGDDVVDVLSAAAVLGTEFAEDAVIDMVDISERDAMNALDVAEHARLLVNIGPSSEKMRFVHALVAGAVYSELPGRRRRRLHAAAARALEGRADKLAPQLTVQLARHCASGGLLVEALHWAKTAGDEATESLSPAEAARWYQTALEHGAALGIGDSERADLLVRLGRAQHQANDADAPATLTEAVELGRRCGATATVVSAALATDRGFLRLGPVAPTQVTIIESALAVADEADTASRARLLALLAEALPRETPGNRRVALAREAIALADIGSDPALLARICSSVLYALWGSNPDATRLRADVARRSAVIAEATGDPHLEFAVHTAAYTVSIQLADPVAATHSLERMHDIAERVGTPEMIWTIDYYDAFVATMEARFADAESLLRNAVGMSAAMGAADIVALFAGQVAALAATAGHGSELAPDVVEAIEAGPVQPTARRAHDIVGVAFGPKEIESDVLDVAMATAFTGVPSDAVWTTSMIGYAMLAIDLEDSDAAVVLLAILEPHAGEVATNLGPVAVYAGRLALLLGEHDRAEGHLTAALEVVDAFGWDLHGASTRIALAGCREERLGRLDTRARLLLDEAERIATDRGLSNMQAEIDRLRAEAPLTRT